MDVLLSCGADITLENDSGESVLDVAGNRLRKQILSEPERGKRRLWLTVSLHLPRVQSRGPLHDQCQGSAAVCMAGRCRHSQEMSGEPSLSLCLFFLSFSISLSLSLSPPSLLSPSPPLPPSLPPSFPPSPLHSACWFSLVLTIWTLTTATVMDSLRCYWLPEMCHSSLKVHRSMSLHNH